MLNSDKRMNFIIEYISAYKKKIELANSTGLFDSATLFEVFATEICCLWFEQNFTNLNSEKSNYPCVDLVSDDEELFVQVSTVKDVPTKIKRTLEKLRDTKKESLRNVNKIIFFVLSNESVGDIIEYTGENAIGRLSFTVKDNLITTNQIIDKAKSDLSFQERLYDLLKSEFENLNEFSLRFKEEIEISKSVGLGNIDHSINGEYEIDRSNLISEISSCDYQFISVVGEAGSGKSVICKKITENEELLLYARAERFTECDNLNGIWGLDLYKALEYTKGKPIVFFIDSLEFIADCSKTKFDLLQRLYEIALKYKNVRIITSCRTSDTNAFINLNSKYYIRRFEVSEISETELIPIVQKYPIIKRMYDMKSYSDLLKSPFYINLIVSSVENLDDINDANELRNYIWQTIICLKNKASSIDLEYSSVVSAIETIVLERAKLFLTGVSQEQINSKILKKLISEGVVIEHSGKIRLKYDIFEDICFEQYFDKLFDDCKGCYRTFFESVEKLGRCVYRRYQIWISNKLLAKQNRDKFLYQLIFCDSVTSKWKEQTEIGLMKSVYCKAFFDDYSKDIIENGIISELINITNLFSFEAKVVFLPSNEPYILLNPLGKGRSCLIDLIFSNGLYKENILNQNNVLKLCTDFARQSNKDDQASKESCEILEFYIDNLMLSKDQNLYDLSDEIVQLLPPIYLLSDYSKEWIISFWRKMYNFCTEGKGAEYRFAEDIIKYTLKNTPPQLAINLPKELCNIAEMFWTFPNGSHNHFHRSLDKCEEYGLNDNADGYEHSVDSMKKYSFFSVLIKHNFWYGLKWLIEFANKCVSVFAEKNPESTKRITLKFLDEDTIRTYLGNSALWMAGIEEYTVPNLIGDFIYLTKKQIKEILKSDFVEMESKIRFANSVKKVIFEKSNNVAFLNIILEIGLMFRTLLPGYSLDLYTSIDILSWDWNRYNYLNPNYSIKLMQEQLFLAVGVPNLKERYEIAGLSKSNMIDYFLIAQISFSENLKEKCHNILDYLYSLVPNDSINALDHLQIQKMDVRNAEFTDVNENVCQITPVITGEAKKIVDENELENKPAQIIDNLFKEVDERLSENEFNLEYNLHVIDELLNLTENNLVLSVHSKELIIFIVKALANKSLDETNRTRLCELWLKGIEQCFSGGSFIFEYNLLPVLLSQIEVNIHNETKNKIKRLILNCVLYNGNNGVIFKITDSVKRFLRSNQLLATSVFNTILRLSEDEINQAKFNVALFNKSHKDKKYSFNPNVDPIPSFIEQSLLKIDASVYKSKKEEIINDYLDNNVSIDSAAFSIDNHNISTLCYIANCGLTLKNDCFARIVKELVRCMIELWSAHNRKRDVYEILDIHDRHQVSELLRLELVRLDNTSEVLELLFKGIDFSKFTSETIEFYHEVFCELLVLFFDSHTDTTLRSSCKKAIKTLEKYVNDIDYEFVKRELLKSVTLLVPHRFMGDWSKCIAGYSFSDKYFLNDIFGKYGKYHLDCILNTIYKLRIDELLPEILISLNICFDSVKSDNSKFKKIINNQNVIVDMVITKAFLNYNDTIKSDTELTNAFEGILESLISVEHEKAAVILDEFRVH